MTKKEEPSLWQLFLSPKIAFLLVSFSLGELGDGLNIFQGIYLVGIGWNEGSVGAALSLMGLTALLVQPLAGDYVDKTTIDRRFFLTTASIMTAISASTILFVRVGNTDHMLMFISKVVEGIASSFIGPCLAALTLATFGPNHFDSGERLFASLSKGYILPYCKYQSNLVISRGSISLAHISFSRIRLFHSHGVEYFMGTRGFCFGRCFGGWSRVWIVP